MVAPFGPGVLPSGGADPQDYYYLMYSMPGSFSRRMYEQRICDPLWPVFGCKTNPAVVGQTVMPDSGAAVETQVVPMEELPPQEWSFWKKLFGAEGGTLDWKTAGVQFVAGAGLGVVSLIVLNQANKMIGMKL